MNITVTLIIQMLAFAAFVILVNKFMWLPLSNIMAQRQKRIEEGLAAAERGRSEKEESEKKAKELLNSSRGQASEIIASAQKQANMMIEEAKTAAVLEIEKNKTQAHYELEQELSRAKINLRSKVSALVIQGVSAVLEKEVNEKTHEAMLTKLSKSL